MKQQQLRAKTNNGFIPSSIKFISSCIKTVSSGVRSASASVAASISSNSEDQKDQVLWACFDRLELGPSKFKHVLLLGYTNGFQVIDVDEASSVNELVSRREDPCTFLQIQPIPAKTNGCEGFRASHPLLLVVTGEETEGSDPTQSRRDGLVREGFIETQTGKILYSPTAVRFYSMRSHKYVHLLRFRSAILMVRCSPRIIAVGLASQIYCFDALTFKSQFSVLTYPAPQLEGPGVGSINTGYGPMDVGPRWLAYASNNPLLKSTGHLSPQSLTPGVSSSTSPGGGSFVAHHATESSKRLASGLINLDDIGYKTFSKYCQQLLADGPNSPVTSNSSCKVGRAAVHSTEMDTAGMVVVKDFVSRAVVSQFRAHTSPISALCFDPSGTLLVTASIHGNNINIFRIMPSSLQNNLGNQNYNGTSSHVHLYKLHRGITSAVIQDICFSDYSKWVAIVSSKGTFHIFVISPYGGGSGLEVNSCVDGSTFLPGSTLPWWSTCTTKSQSFRAPPPPTVTLSVVSRIRTGNSGWINTVSCAASSAAGIVSIPSGAVSAVFHCSIPYVLPAGGSQMAALEHLLVYSPSGHLIQFKLLPSMGGELSGTSRPVSASLTLMQDEELRVKSEPVQWWDVCRRADWPEREECIMGITSSRKDASVIVVDSSDFEDNDASGDGAVKHHEYSHLYLSNAEVQISYGRIPIWQNYKMHFYTMSLVVPPKALMHSEDYTGGEIEIEKVHHHKVVTRQKDLLPVFDRAHSVQSDGSDRCSSGEYPDFHFRTEEKPSGDAIFSLSKMLSVDPDQNSKHGASELTQPFHDSNQMHTVKAYLPTLPENNGKSGSCILASLPLNEASVKYCSVPTSIYNATMDICPAVNTYLVNSPSSKNDSLSAESMPEEVSSSNNIETSDTSNVSFNSSDFSMNIVDEGSGQDLIDCGRHFQEEYCKALPLDECLEVAEVIPYVDSSNSPCDKKSEEDGESDEMVGGVFAFSEDGIDMCFSHVECNT
ncbi:hypothetical protein Nepgr_012294 [Nepenthes gracilis]|uniref:Autophagy-related protein 18h n=1 Tax=Nepenthes gracilis TaxID=150966 RepID=A0AAD3XMX8_NEPGR|nr:hypothetical protein Nepgr_012294 [Nepenthes gracilis]